jgi:uncharacterized protein YfaS (alpha-2-macroglobulin family)
MCSADTNSVRLLLSELAVPEWRQDIPRLARGALGRQIRGHWSTTVANAWGVLAMEKFSQAFESVPVTGQIFATLGAQARTVDWRAASKTEAFSMTWPERQSSMELALKGTGAPWATIQSMAAIPLREALSSGFSIKKSMIPVEQKQNGVWSPGDVVRVKLEVESQADMTWVVLNDPIPAGSAILGTGLGRDSQLSTRGEEMKGWVWPAFEERSLEGYRAYFHYVPKGAWSVEYTMRLNNLGEFQLPPTRVEAMYSPEMFGEIPNAAVQVR